MKTDVAAFLRSSVVYTWHELIKNETGTHTFLHIIPAGFVQLDRTNVRPTFHFEGTLPNLSAEPHKPSAADCFLCFFSCSVHTVLCLEAICRARLLLVP